jgi:hypothetical protein
MKAQSQVLVSLRRKMSIFRNRKTLKNLNITLAPINQKSKAQTQNVFKIAFGSKIPKVPPIVANTPNSITSAKVLLAYFSFYWINYLLKVFNASQSQTNIDQVDLYDLSLKSKKNFNKHHLIVKHHHNLFF